MPEKKLTLNRFPLFGLFAYRAAKKLDYSENDARLLGFSTALLYAIFKAKSQAKKEKPEKEKKEPTKEIEAKTATVEFGGQQFTVIPGETSDTKHVQASSWVRFESDCSVKKREGLTTSCRKSKAGN